jgi:hypothetical protein
MTFFDNYVNSIEKYIQFVKKAIPNLPSENTYGKRIGVVITPWLFTPVPWFFLTIALMFRHRGFRPVIVWDDLPFEEDPRETDIENKAIETVLGLFKEMGFEIHILSKLQSILLTDDDYVEIRRLAYLDAVWKHGTSVSSPEIERLTDHNKAVLALNLPKIKKCLEDISVKAVIVEGGIYRNSGLFLYAGKQLGVRVTTYETCSWTGINSVAGHAMDIPKVLKSNFLRNGVEKQTAIDLAKTEFKCRHLGWDESGTVSGFHHRNVDGLTYDVVIPLNIDYDCQALGKSRFFKNASEWLLETIHFILEKTTATVVVRQHPDEKVLHPGIHRNVLLERIIRSRFGNIPRFKFITCDESVKTYELIERAKLVLPLTSTVGIEAGIMGKKVIMESSAYYAGLPFASQAVSKQDYFKQIWEFLNSEGFEADEGAIESALLVFYLSQICNRTPIHFTPDPPAFDNWVKSGFTELLYDEHVEVLIHSLAEGVPLAEIQNRKILEKHLACESGSLIESQIN